MLLIGENVGNVGRGTSSPQMNRPVQELRDISQTERQINAIGESLTELDEAVNILGQRLEKVLRTEPYEEEHGKAECEEALIPLADTLRMHNRRVLSVVNKVRVVTHLLEL